MDCLRDSSKITMFFPNFQTLTLLSTFFCMDKEDSKTEEKENYESIIFLPILFKEEKQDIIFLKPILGAKRTSCYSSEPAYSP